MRLFEITLTAAIAIVFSAASANALVSVFHTNDTGGATVAQGGTFNVDVVAAYDGLDSSLAGIFVSAAWDPSELLLTNATDAPLAIFLGPNGFLQRFTNPQVFPGDPPGTIRTVQFAAFPGEEANAGPSDDEPIPVMQRILDNPFLLLFLGVVIPTVFYILWGVMEIVSIPIAQ